MKKRETAATMITALVCCLYAVLFLLVTWIHFTQYNAGDREYMTAVAVLTLTAGPLFILVSATKFAESRCAYWCLLAVCLTVKLAWVLAFRTEPAVDYLTFYRTAQMLAANWTIDFHYVALFPHILGYSTFLSMFFILFGDGALVAPIVNVILTVISMAFIYDIAKRIMGGRAAFIAAAIWILYPSQTIYNTMVLSEPLYTTLILGFWAWMIRLTDRFDTQSWRAVTITAIGAAMLLGWIDAVRPLAAVVYLALAIWLLLTADWGYKHGMLRRVAFLAVLGLGFWTSGQAVDLYQDARLGEEAAKSVGYNIYVGFNEESRGKWNQADSDHLFSYVDQHPGWTADDVQRQMLEDAKDRIFHGDIDFVGLFYDKLHLLWADDAMAYKYSDLPADATGYITASNAFYIFTVVLSMLGLVRVIRRDRRSPAVMLCLFMLGLTAAHLLSEVAFRYHYSGTAVLAVLAGAGVGGWHIIRYPVKQGGVYKRLSTKTIRKES